MADDATFTVGLDLGDRYSHLCVVDGAGQVVTEGRVRTLRSDLEGTFGGKGRQRIVLEVGTHSPWVSRLLTGMGHEVWVANPRKVRLIWQGDRKSDRLDAEALARLGRVDPQLLSPIRHRGEDGQLGLSMVRARAALVRSRTQLISHVRGAVKSVGGRMPSSSAERFSRLGETMPDSLREVMSPVMACIDELTSKIQIFDERIEALCERYPETGILRSVPGVGPLTALTYVLTLEDPSRFSSSRMVGPYLGLVAGRAQSGTRDPQQHITRAGDVYLRQLLVGSAQRLLGPFGADSELRRWGLRVAERGGSRGKKRAVVAVARKLAVLLHHLWRTGSDYEPFPKRRMEADTQAA